MFLSFIFSFKLHFMFRFHYLLFHIHFHFISIIIIIIIIVIFIWIILSCIFTLFSSFNFCFLNDYNILFRDIGRYSRRVTNFSEWLTLEF